MRERCWYLTEVVVAWSLEKALWCFDKKTLIEKEREKTNIDSASVSQSVLWTRYGKKKLSAVCWTWVWEASVNWFFFLWFRHWGEKSIGRRWRGENSCTQNGLTFISRGILFFSPSYETAENFCCCLCTRERERERARGRAHFSPLSFQFSCLAQGNRAVYTQWPQLPRTQKPVRERDENKLEPFSCLLRLSRFCWKQPNFPIRKGGWEWRKSESEWGQPLRKRRRRSES